jgi:hypothetical protein
MSETEKDITLAAATTSIEQSKIGDDQPAGSSLTVAGTSSNNADGVTATAVTTGKDTEKGANSETRKMGSFPSDLSTIKPVFSLKSKNQQAKDRFS